MAVIDPQRPGVYIEEIPLFPPSVAGVSTAVPAFIGYTFNDNNVFTPIRITNFLEFKTIFGGPPPLNYKIGIDNNPSNQEDIDAAKQYILYYAVKMFFQYGDSPCYIVSTGTFLDSDGRTCKTSLKVDDFDNALKELRKYDEPTIIVIPDAISLINANHDTNTSYADYKSIISNALKMCEDLKDRFVIVDVAQRPKNNPTVTTSYDDFRKSGVNPDNLKYGAAYFPYLLTSFNYELDETKIEIDKNATSTPIDIYGLRIYYIGSSGKIPQIEIIQQCLSVSTKVDTDILFLYIKGIGDGVSASNLAEPIKKVAGFEAYPIGDGSMMFTDSTKFIADHFWFITDANGLCIKANLQGSTPPLVVFSEDTKIRFETEPSTNKLIVFLPAIDQSATEVIAQWNNLPIEFDRLGFTLSLMGTGETKVAVKNAPKRLQVFRNALADGVSLDSNGILIGYSGVSTIGAPVLKRFNFIITDTPATPKLTIAGYGENGVAPTSITDAWKEEKHPSFKVEPVDDTILSAGSSQTLYDLKTSDNKRYNAILAKLMPDRVVLPPSSSIAGIYAKVDRERGVWKAPANVGLTGVVGPSIKITDEEHNNLNLDPNSGKSINAIRNYTGKGTLVMGARTLAGNDNEWRYINVRRLFNMVEESVKKATEAFLFEPNNITTWLKVKGMIESYLYGLWQRGALTGSTPEQAYFVNVGLGKTMTAQEILEGKLNVEIGMAAVRPAEFIILRFSHKMQEA